MIERTNLFGRCQPKIAVIGAGVIGLACIVKFINSGYRSITLIAEKFSPDTTSNLAAAVSFPNKSYSKPEINWYQQNLVELNKFLAHNGMGVSRLPYIELCKAEADTITSKYISEYDYQIPEGYDFKYAENIFLINSVIHMNYLMNFMKEQKIPIEIKKIKDIKELTKDFEIIINCTGLGARDLVKDEKVFPLRGQIIILSKPKSLNFCIGELAENITYIIPRSEDCIIGGTAEENNWDLKPDSNTTHLILDRAMQLYPPFKNEKLIDVKVGLRPMREKIRLNAEKLRGSLIIHNYGHGGEGYSFAWGCAQAVNDLLTEYLNS